MGNGETFCIHLHYFNVVGIYLRNLLRQSISYLFLKWMILYKTWSWHSPFFIQALPSKIIGMVRQVIWCSVSGWYVSR